MRFHGALSDLRLQPEEVETVVWMDRAELAQLLEQAPCSPDAAVACRRWLREETEAAAGAATAAASAATQRRKAPPPGAFHPGMVCAAKQTLIVGYRYARPATEEDRQAATAAGYNPMETYSLCQEAFDELSPEEQCTFECIDPPIDPARLAIAAFGAALLLGSAAGILSTGRFLDGSTNGAAVLEVPSEFAEAPTQSPAEALLGLVFGAPGR